MCRFYVQGIEHYTRCSPLASSHPLPLSPSPSFFLFVSVSQSTINASGNDAPSHWRDCAQPFGNANANTETSACCMLRAVCCVLCVLHAHTQRDTDTELPRTRFAVGQSARRQLETASIKVNVTHWLHCECYECYEYCECCEYFMSIANV